MAAPQASSRLEMLQARFQQKQLQEKEQKLLQLYDQQQQRAYQVAQRGSSGSNSSGQGISTVNHHHQIVTRTSSSGHTTSTSQATKVKQQVFNDRRQTTSVKGIDRSYPLEPLDNKTRKQPTTNGIIGGNSRNNGLTVNRQSITVKRVTRSDLNSNVNDTKPIVSYHEEITRESSSSRDVPNTIESPKEDDTEVFDNENHTAHYVNGNYPDQVQMGNIMDEDTIQRNRMMAKLHLMQYDETLKYRVKNDLESEEFPEDLLVEVTDKIPKRTVSKKLSQAEARLERFKNMNAKRNNAIKLLNSTTTGSKKRSEPLLTSSRTNSRIGITGIKTTTTTTTTTTPTATTTTKKNKNKTGSIREKQSNKFKIGKGSVKYGQVTFEKSKTVDGKSKKIQYDRKTGASKESSIFQKRKADVPCKDETIDPTDSTFFSNESKKSATKISIDTLDSKRKSKPLSNTKRQIQNREISSSRKVNNFPTATASNNDKRSYKTHGKRDSYTFSPYRRPTSVSSTTTSLESKKTPSSSPELIRTLKKRDASPEFFCVETKKSATTMSLKPKPVTNLNENKRYGINSDRDFQSKMSQKMIAKQSPSYLKLERNIRKSSDSSETSNKSSNLVLKSRRGSINALRSIQLIRNAMKTENVRKEDNTKVEEDRFKIYPTKYSKIIPKENKKLKDSRKSIVDPIRKDSLKIDVTDLIDLKNVPNRERKFSLKNLHSTLQLSPKSPKSPKSTKSFTSAEVDTEIQEITMTDQHVSYNDPICKNNEKRKKNTKSISDETYSKSSAMKLRNDDKKTRTTNLLTYPIKKEKKKTRTSILDSNIFHLKDETDKVRRFKESNRSLSEKSLKKDENRVSMDLKGLTSSKLSKKDLSENKNEKIIVSLGKRRNSVDLKTIKNESTRSKSSSSICTNEDTVSKYQTTNVSLRDITFDESRKEIQRRSSSPFLYKNVIRTSTKETKSENANEELLKSTELIRRVIRAQSSDKQDNLNTKLTESIKPNKSFDRFSNQISIISLSSNDNYYGRTNSVESALRRFDSIGAESEYQETIGRDYVDGIITKHNLSSSKMSLEKTPIKFTNDVKESIKTKARVLESSKVKKNQSKSDTKKNTKNINVGILKKSPNTSSDKILLTKVDTLRQGCKGKKIAEAKDSMEISRTSKSRSLTTCKRKLFENLERSDERKIGRVGCMLNNSFRRKNQINVKRRKSMESSTIENEQNKRKEEKKKKKEEEEEEEKENKDEDDRTVAVKPLRSIEDIRKSIVCDSSGRTVVALTQITDIDLGREAETGSAIANEILKASTKSESQSRIVVDSDPLNRKIIPSKNRSKNNNSHLRDYGKILSTNSLRLNRINKSPTPESINSKKMSSDVDCRTTTVLTRRSVPSSPSKSPDILPRRVSTIESKTQETKPSIKSSFTKASDTITSKRSATRTDVPNVLQNGLHLQEQIVERKEQNELPKKCQAFTIDFEERSSSKTNDTTDSKRPLAKKQSMEKQQQHQTLSSSSAISGRPTSSTSSASSSNPTQSQISKGRMATRARTPISNTPTSKGSSCIKSGPGQNATENLAACKVCGRRFAQDRVTLHEQICAKTVQKKRKQFDTTMYRVKGTELESFVKKGSKKFELKSKKPEVKSNWRRKHEEFINAIRSAKQVQAHLAAGGRLSDLPPPPVSDTSDYIQCPHCGRKFNQAAAERHIPKCEHMLHNKPSSRAAPPRPRR